MTIGSIGLLRWLILTLVLLGLAIGVVTIPDISVNDTTNAVPGSDNAHFNSHNTTLPGEDPPTKLSSGVARQVSKRDNEPSGAGTTAGMQSIEDKIEIQLTIIPNATQSVQQTIRNTGGSVRVAFDDGIVAAVPPDAIERLREMEVIKQIKLPETGATAEITNGTKALNANTVQNDGITGENVSVAVIDTRFNANNPAIAENVVQTKNIQSGEQFENVSDDHGTATAEVITDTAPNVSLILISTPDISETGVESALRFADRNTSADIVTMSLTFSTGPFDGSSKMGELITNTTQNGTPVFVSAGNYAHKNHLNTSFTDGDNDGTHNFSSSNEQIKINTSVLDESDNLVISVNWNDYSFSGINDFNITLRDGSGAIVRVSKNRQSNFPPTERIILSNPTDDPYTLSITGDVQNDPVEFNIFTRKSELNRSTAQQSVARPAVAEESIAIGAVSPEKSKLRSYSSRGPTIDGRQKPNLVAPDGVSTSLSGKLETYLGTSASAPHAAGTAALVIEAEAKANISLTTAQLTSALINTANTQPINRFPTEPNNRVGAGLIDAASAVAEVESNDATGVRSCQDIIIPGWGEVTDIISITNNQNCISIAVNDITPGSNNIIQCNNFCELSDFNVTEISTASNVIIQNVEMHHSNDVDRLDNTSNGTVANVTAETAFKYRRPPVQSIQSNVTVLSPN